MDDNLPARKPMTRRQAEALTERIRDARVVLWEMLTEADDHRAWEAMGYVSMEEYARTEFGIAKSSLHRNLLQGHVNRELEAARPEGGNVQSPARGTTDDSDTSSEPVSQRQAAALAAEPALLDAAKEAVAAGASPADASAEVIAQATPPAVPRDPTPTFPKDDRTPSQVKADRATAALQTVHDLNPNALALASRDLLKRVYNRIGTAIVVGTPSEAKGRIARPARPGVATPTEGCKHPAYVMRHGVCGACKVKVR